jgi:hypothetical protein
VSSRRVAWLTIALAAFGALSPANQSIAGEPAPECRQEWSSFIGGWPFALSDIAFGIHPDEFSRMLRGLDPNSQVASSDVIPVELMARAAARVGTLDQSVGRRRDAVAPAPSLDPVRPVAVSPYYQVRASDQAATNQDPRYRTAVELYYQGKFREAVPAFDTVAADRTSPERPAAAYSAARAQVLSGNLADGFARIGSILKDGSLRAFHGAAYHLVGTLAYQSNDPRLRAAKYAQMLVLGLPDGAACDDQSQILRKEELEDLSWYVGMYQEPVAAIRVLDEIAELDPRLDLLRTLVSPGPASGHAYSYQTSERLSWPDGALAEIAGFAWNGPTSLGPAPSSDAIERWASVSGRQITAHAREQWIATGNFLWALAFAQRTGDPHEYKTIVSMIESLKLTSGGVPSEDARTALHLQFLLHAVRLALLDNKPREAKALMERNRSIFADGPKMTFDKLAAPDAPLMALRSAVVEAPIIHHLRRGQFAAARDWAKQMRGKEDYEEARMWDSLLATRFKDVFDRPTTDRNAFYMYYPLGAAFDLQSTKAMVKLSREDKAPEPLRRALLGAAFVRLFALDRQSKWSALLTDMTKYYPELERELSEINKSRERHKQKFLAASLLLGNPGIGIYFSNQHNLDSYQTGRAPMQRDLRDIDSDNPNDGNWWCPLEPAVLKTSLGRDFFVFPTGSGIHGAWGSDGRVSEEMQELGDQLITSHPLLRDYDASEVRELSKVESGTQQLARVVFEWIDRSGAPRTAQDSEQIAKALHDVVRATRYGCRRAGSTREVSHEAFRRLHKDFPDSEWTRDTPYWFDMTRH